MSESINTKLILSNEALKKRKRCCSGYCCCSSFACVSVLIPILAAVVCCALYFTGYSRVDNITMYNERALQWNTTDIHNFRDLSINATINDETYMMAETNTKDYDTYPVHDHCDEDGDPFAGCVDVDVLYYSVSIPISSTYSLAIAEDDQAPFIDELISGSYNELIMNTTLDCSDAITCAYKCSQLGGKYTAKTGMCKIKKYLAHACFRVAFDDAHHIKTDLPPAMPLNGYEPSSNFTGCYGDRAWDYSHFQTDEPEEVVFEIRYYNDPYIVASSITEGCSTDPETLGDYCMGLSRYQLKYYYVIVMIAMFVILAVELFIYILAALVKKDNICLKKPTTPVV